MLLPSHSSTGVWWRYRSDNCDPNPGMSIEALSVYDSGVLQLTTISGKKSSIYLQERPSCSDAFIGIRSKDNTTIVYYRFDVRQILVTNTLESPASVNSAAQTVCSTVQKNFINEATCVRRAPSESCSLSTFASASLPLTTETLRNWFVDSSKYV